MPRRRKFFLDGDYEDVRIPMAAPANYVGAGLVPVRPTIDTKAARKQANDKLRDDLSGRNGFWTALAANLQRAGDPTTAGGAATFNDDVERLEGEGLHEDAKNLRTRAGQMALTAASVPMLAHGLITAPLATAASLAGGGLVDGGVRLASGNRYSGFGNMMSNVVGGNEMLWDFANPGYGLGGFGAKLAFPRLSTVSMPELYKTFLGKAFNRPIVNYRGNAAHNRYNLENAGLGNHSQVYNRPQESIPTLWQANDAANFIKGLNNTPALALPQSTGIYPQIKPLIKGAEIEKQLSKAGTISRKGLSDYIAKQRTYYQELMNKVLDDEFKGVDKIDYGAFQDAVMNRLPKYTRVPQTEWADFGMDRLGYTPKSEADLATDPRLTATEVDITPAGNRARRRRALRYTWNDTGERFGANAVRTIDWYNENLPTTNTFTFESPGIIGHNQHFTGNPIGHSRTYTTKEEPNTLHVMESQSDWAQRYYKEHRKSSNLEQLQKDLAYVEQKIKENDAEMMSMDPDAIRISLADVTQPVWKKDKERLIREIEELRYFTANQALFKHMVDNYIPRQIQENLRYAAEQGQTKMRYPTRETADKIENFDAVRDRRLDMSDGEAPIYDDDLETILKKYDAFPKAYQKIFGKEAEVRTVTDGKGNTWYEVDVPESYKNKTGRIVFSNGGRFSLRNTGLTRRVK